MRNKMEIAGKNRRVSRTTAQGREFTPGERQLIKKYRKLSAGGKEEMIHYLDFRLSSEAPRVEKRFKNILSVIFRERK